MSIRFFFLATFFFSAPAFCAPEKNQAPAPVVFVDTAKTVPLFDLLSYPARVNPKVNATVLSEAEGVVSKLITPLGRSVAKNQKIILIKNTDPIYDYAPFVVLSPVKGVVSSVEVTEGSRVAKGQRLLTITDPAQVAIFMEVAVSDLSAIHTDLVGELHLATNETTVPVKIVGMSPFIDPATGTATAELAFTAKTANPLPPGLVGTVTFKAREHQGFQIPESAVVYRGKETFIRVVEDGKAKYVPVTVGQTRRGMAEILKGLKEETKIIVRTSSFISEGEAVSIQKAEGPQS